MPKPYDNQDCGGQFFNVPLAYDASDTPITSPIAAGETKELVVHPAAGRVVFFVNGTAAATVTIMKGSTDQSGTISLPPGVQSYLDCGGMNGAASANFPDKIEVVAGADSPVSFAFLSTSADGQ